MKRFPSLLLSLFLLLTLTGCGADQLVSIAVIGGADGPTAILVGEPTSSEEASSSGAQYTATDSSDDSSFSLSTQTVEEGEYYYDLEDVVLYLETYDCLPDNYITKSQARDLGWTGGSVERYLEGAAIGGDSFGNRESKLPREQGRAYTECDLNTDGADSRGAERLVFSNDGLYFHTEDHYETFTQVWVEEGEVIEGEVVW